MTNGWSGPEPAQFSESGAQNYELATRYSANGNITISGIRVWSGLSLNVPGRNARIWNTGGSVLATVDIDDTLPGGDTWTTYNLATPLDVANGATIDVSYSTIQHYGLVGAVAAAYPRNSGDALVTATQGRFSETIGLFPSNTSTSFYGIDIIYTEDVGANEPPSVTGVVLTKNDLVVTATATVTDEVPSTVVVTWEWGDGSSTVGAAGVFTAQHTYTSGGIYAVLATATDADGLDDSAAAAISLSASATAASNEEWLDDIFDAVVSDVQRSGHFDRVNMHEPKRGPRTGLTSAIWVASVEPIALASGLNSTSARIVFTLRMYQSMLKEPQDMIDPMMTKAVSNLMRRYHDDFDFEGIIRNIDLLGQFGVSLSAISGYLEIDNKVYRIMDMTIPCIVNDVWPQVS